MSKLAEYLNILDSNAEQQAVYESNPEKSMRSFGFNDAEISNILAGDLSGLVASSQFAAVVQTSHTTPDAP